VRRRVEVLKKLVLALVVVGDSSIGIKLRCTICGVHIGVLMRALNVWKSSICFPVLQKFS
jgi:hypothetical protein